MKTNTATSHWISLYWKCQLIGWSLTSLWWAYQGLANSIEKSYTVAAIHFIGDCSIGILLTHSYRNLSLKNGWNKLNLDSLLPRIILSVGVLGSLFMFLIAIKLYLVRMYFIDQSVGSFTDFFKDNWMTLLVTGVRLMSVWVLAFHLYHYAQYRIQMAEENAQLSILAKQTQLNNLSAQLNPHFFFNSLNNIKFLVIENPQEARRAIDLLSDLLRTSLYRKEEHVVSIKQELNLVNDYLELEKLRFEERLQIQMNIPEEVMAYEIPPFSIQTLVENAIKHGISTRKEGGLVSICIEKQGSYLKIAIENSGMLSNSTTPGLGIRNLTERLNLQFAGKATFALTAQENDKVLATICIPAL
ncbi:histidine kinase [Cytophagaceae bacterium YF14B1]|uniref:Histidine kinase n=1 Tax=Xanthocytophaga flava TaxID=3048013 RepID=A0AAE3U9A5_9BACT|nr:histidine kinase [Xanthocytophaga flavus]MDJ1484874.1 histidine kinase [Xanthocytophaga flavus]